MGLTCSTHGYTQHSSEVWLFWWWRWCIITRLETMNNAISFESMEMIITIVSISIRLVVIYRMSPSRNNKLKRATFSDYVEKLSCCCCLPTPMALASGGSPMFPLVVHQPASPSIWPAVQSLRRGLSTNPGATMWCVCGCS